MLKMIVFSLFAFLLVTAWANPLHNSISHVEELEEPCVRQGGICMRTADCDPGNMVQVHVNLCPAQTHLNVLCCYI